MGITYLIILAIILWIALLEITYRHEKFKTKMLFVAQQILFFTLIVLVILIVLRLYAS